MIFVWFLLVVGLSNGAQESNNQVITTTRIEEEKSHDQPVKPSWNFKDGSISLQNVYAEPLGAMVRFYFPCIMLLYAKDVVDISGPKKDCLMRGWNITILRIAFYVANNFVKIV